MTSATPEPRAGEHSTDPMLNDLMLIKAERDLLRERERELVGLLELAERLRPAMLKSFGYVPEYVLDFCNRARALTKHGR